MNNLTYHCRPNFPILFYGREKLHVCRKDHPLKARSDHKFLLLNQENIIIQDSVRWPTNTLSGLLNWTRTLRGQRMPGKSPQNYKNHHADRNAENKPGNSNTRREQGGYQIKISKLFRKNDYFLNSSLRDIPAKLTKPIPKSSMVAGSGTGSSPPVAARHKISSRSVSKVSEEVR